MSHHNVPNSKDHDPTMNTIQALPQKDRKQQVQSVWWQSSSKDYFLHFLSGWKKKSREEWYFMAHWNYTSSTIQISIAINKSYWSPATYTLYCPDALTAKVSEGTGSATRRAWNSCDLAFYRERLLTPACLLTLSSHSVQEVTLMSV